MSDFVSLYVVPTQIVLSKERICCLVEKVFSAVIFVAVVQSLSCVRLFVTPWIAARQAPLSCALSRSLLKFMSIGLVMPSNHLILCPPLLLLSSIFPSIWVFSNESVLHIKWPRYWTFCFSLSPSSEWASRWLRW